MKRTIDLALVFCLAVTLPVVAELGQVKTDVKTLADDSMGGRMTGSEGEKLAADYITEELKNLGMIPLPKFGSFLQPFEFTAGMDDG